MVKNKGNENKKYYIIIAVLSVLIICVIAAIISQGGLTLKDSEKGGITNSESIADTNDDGKQGTVTDGDTAFLDVIDRSDAKKVRFTMTDGQQFTMELYPKLAPITVENFLKLVDGKFYDGLTFHRIIAGFMAQGGAFDPENQANDPADSIKGEFASNGVENNLSHMRGVVSMARTSIPDSASSQFFICYDDASSLDGDYAAFGYVTEGMEVVDSFLDGGTDAQDRPLKEVKIKTAVRID